MRKLLLFLFCFSIILSYSQEGYGLMLNVKNARYSTVSSIGFYKDFNKSSFDIQIGTNLDFSPNRQNDLFLSAGLQLPIYKKIALYSQMSFISGITLYPARKESLRYMEHDPCYHNKHIVLSEVVGYSLDFKRINIFPFIGGGFTNTVGNTSCYTKGVYQKVFFILGINLKFKLKS